jgi:hypothetical protein
LVKESVSELLDERDKKKADKLMNTALGLATQLTLQTTINKGLEQALLNEKKRRKRGKNVLEEIRAEDSHAANFYSPTKIQYAIDL